MYVILFVLFYWQYNQRFLLLIFRAGKIVSINYD